MKCDLMNQVPDRACAIPLNALMQCEYWNLTAEKYYTIEGGAATVKSDCKPTDQANKVIA